MASPFLVQGMARVFEANVQFALKNAQGQEIARGFTTASAGAPEWGAYSAAISYRLTETKQNGVIEVFSQSPRDGSVINLVRVPVVLLLN